MSEEMYCRECGKHLTYEETMRLKTICTVCDDHYWEDVPEDLEVDNEDEIEEGE